MRIVRPFRPDLIRPPLPVVEGALRRLRRRQIRDPRLDPLLDRRCAIALDTSADFGAAGASPWTTATYTPSGANRLLFLCVQSQTGFAAPTATRAGDALNQLATVDAGAAGVLTVFYDIGPVTSATAFVITYSGSSTHVSAGAVSYTGAKQSGVPDASTTNTVTSVDNIATSLTSIADNCWMLYFVADSVSVSGYTFTNVTLRQNLQSGGTLITDTNGVIHPAGSLTATVANTGNSQDWGAILASFAPVLSGQVPYQPEYFRAPAHAY